jgi:hypothetical protein
LSSLVSAAGAAIAKVTALRAVRRVVVNCIVIIRTRNIRLYKCRVSKIRPDYCCEERKLRGDQGLLILLWVSDPSSSLDGQQSIFTQESNGSRQLTTRGVTPSAFYPGFIIIVFASQH